MNLIGHKFGRLAVTEFAGVKNKHHLWNCVCDCGNITKVLRSNLRSGHTQSCGCLRVERAREDGTSHGHARSKGYHVWGQMIQRCHNPKDTAYKNYGARGITVCDRWRSFENFYKDMGRCPEGLSIERINNDKGYEPGNCKWATQRDQCNNKKNTHWLEFNGVKKPLAEWARISGLHIETLRGRLKGQDWTIEEALTLPSRPGIPLRNRRTI